MLSRVCKISTSETLTRTKCKANHKVLYRHYFLQTEAGPERTELPTNY